MNEIYNLFEKEFFSDLSALTNLAKRISGNAEIAIIFIDQAIAFTDCKAIYIPSKYKEDISSSQGLIAHEAGHIGYGSFEMAFKELLDSLTNQYKITPHIAMNIINLVEDVRINKINKKKFPGFYKNLRSLTKRLLPNIKSKMNYEEDLLLYINLYMEDYKEFQDKPNFYRTTIMDQDWACVVKNKQFLYNSLTPSASIIVCHQLCRVLKKYFPNEKLEKMRKAENSLGKLELNIAINIENNIKFKKGLGKKDFDKISENLIKNIKKMDLNSKDIDDIIDFFEEIEEIKETVSRTEISEKIKKNLNKIQEETKREINETIEKIVDDVFNINNIENDAINETLNDRLKEKINEIHEEIEKEIKETIEMVIEDETKDKNFKDKEIKETVVQKIQEEIKRIEDRSKTKIAKAVKDTLNELINENNSENESIYEKLNEKIVKELMKVEEKSQEEVCDKVNKLINAEINDNIFEFNNIDEALNKYIEKRFSNMNGFAERKDLELKIKILRESVQLINEADNLLRERLIKLEYGNRIPKQEDVKNKRKVIETRIENELMSPINISLEEIEKKSKTIIKKMKMLFAEIRNQEEKDNFQKKGRLNSNFIKAITSDYKFKQCFTHKIQNKDLRLLILVDISGSMQGIKLISAKTALIMLCEALEGLAKLRIVLFTGDYHALNILLKDFSEAIDPRKMNKFGCHQKQMQNIDGLSIKHEAEKLDKNDIIIIISDGQPAGSGGYGLYEAIIDVQRVKKKHKIFAFSIDANGDYLNQLYNNDWILTSSKNEIELGEKLIQLCRLILKEHYKKF